MSLEVIGLEPLSLVKTTALISLVLEILLTLHGSVDIYNKYFKIGKAFDNQLYEYLLKFVFNVV